MHLEPMATLLRTLCADMVEHAGSGHPGMPMGMADVATVLFARHFTFAPQQPEWIKRDRFVLSSGHGSALAYALLHLIGSAEMTLDELKRLRRKGSRTPGHPEFGHTRGIECTTGPLGQGFATAVGMAISEKKLRAELGEPIAGHRIFVMAGDGCLMEGISHEAGALAGHLRLDNLVVLFDDNNISIDGSTALASSEDVLARFNAYGWTTEAVDGHDLDKIDAALERTKTSRGPTLIACKTTIGRGAPAKAGTAGIHGSALGATEMAAMREALAWPHAPFDFPAGTLAAWRSIGDRGLETWLRWERLFAEESSEVRCRVRAVQQRARPLIAPDTWKAIRAEAAKQTGAEATRISSRQVLQHIVAQCSMLLGGSADLSTSNGTRVESHVEFTHETPDGTYLRYGVREHAMAAAMNGIALSGAYTPYGGTFLAFSDYSRPAIRLSALMGLRVVHVFTHDSIGLGEDGPTHQPVEQLASLRLIPGLQVLRPADAVETAECWELALAHDGPTLLALSRQDLPRLRSDTDSNRSHEGAYILSDADGAPDVTILASGSEVHLALGAKDILAADGLAARVVSVPCLERLQALSAPARDALLARGSALQVAVEAGSTMPWKALLGPAALTFGIDCFGASCSAAELFSDFGLTAEAIARSILEQKGQRS